MADEIKSLRRNKKVAGIEDPIVIVQRLLNVYRQLHILDEKQREDFDKMVLQQPPEIRHMCSTLPGGSLLQEYVDELEEKYGVAPDQNIGAEHLESGKENILANALADETPSAQAPAQSASVSADTSANQDIQKQMLMMMQTMQSQSANSGGGATIKADSGFAKEIASAISGALAISDEKRRKETAELTKSLTDSQMEMTKTLVEELGKRQNSPAPAPAVISEGGVRVIDNTAEVTKAITESQLEMAKMFLQHNAISASNSNANNANNIQINNAPMPNSQELIGDIIKAQSQLFREMAKEQTKELSSIISAALKESYQLSNKTLVNTLTAFQKENLNFFKQQAKNQTVIYQQAPLQTGNAVPVAEPVYQYVQEEPTNAQTSAEPSYIKKVFGNMFNRMHSPEEAANAPEISDSANEAVEYEYIEVPAEDVSATENVSYENQTDDVTSPDAPVFEDDSLTEQNDSPLIFENEPSIDKDILPDESSDDVLESAPVSSAEKKKKKKKKKKKNTQADNELLTASAPLSKADQEIRELLDFGDGGNNFETFDMPGSDNGLDISLFASDLPNEKEEDTAFSAQNDVAETQTEIFEEISADKNDIIPDINSFTAEENQESEIFTDNEIEHYQPDLSLESDILPEPSENAEPETIEDGTPETISALPEDNTPAIEAIEEIEKKDGVKTIQHSGLIPDLNNKEVAENLFNSADNFSEDVQPLDLDADYKISLDAADTDSSENNDEEWEWEYEEVPEDEGDAPVEAQAAEETADGEWEWEYEEVPEDGGDAPVEAQAAEETADGEWEWEYEEVPEDEGNAPVEAQAAEETADGEWEWEYEEVPEDEGDAPVEAQAAEETADGEWEWEYEEVPEDGGDAPVEAQTAEETAADEWEWEYEDDTANDDLSATKTNSDLSIEAPASDMPDDNALSAEDDVDFSDLFNEFDRKTDMPENSVSDPYSGSSDLPDNGLDMTSLQSGDLYFQDEIPASENKKQPVFSPMEDSGNETILPDWNEDEDKNEPYRLNSDLKP